MNTDYSLSETENTLRGLKTGEGITTIMESKAADLKRRNERYKKILSSSLTPPKTSLPF